MRARTLVLGWAIGVLAVAPLAGQRQDSTRRELRESQLRLEQIRAERERLEREMQQLRTRVRDVSSELANIERQVAASAEVLQELDFQQATLEESIENIRLHLARSRLDLRERTEKLNRRLRAMYKRGPLHTVRVLLSAESFSDLLTRYRYLQVLAVHDRALIREVRSLEADLVEQERLIADQLDQLAQLQDTQLREVSRLEGLELAHERTLQSYRSRQRQTEGRLVQLERDAARLTSLIDELERRRREEERRRTLAGEPAEANAITTRDLGALRWPVEGRLIYRFGPERRPNGVILRWNGVGIGAAAGAPVQAVEDGTVVLAGPFEGYGPSVMISHGGGYYTLYLYLGALRVRTDQRVRAGDVIGTVGAERSPEGPHIEFQVRAPVNGAPVAVDPLSWLRARSRGS